MHRNKPNIIYLLTCILAHKDRNTRSKMMFGITKPQYVSEYNQSPIVT